VESLAPTGNQSPDCTGRSESLYQLHYPVPQLIWQLSLIFISQHIYLVHAMV